MSKIPVKLKARIEKRWVLSVGGVEIPMRFIKTQEMAGMALLTDEVGGSQMVVDIPDSLATILSPMIEMSEDMEVSVVKVSSTIGDAVKKAYAEAARIAEERDEDGEPAEEPTPEPETEPEGPVSDEPMGPLDGPEEDENDG